MWLNIGSGRHLKWFLISALYHNKREILLTGMILIYTITQLMYFNYPVLHHILPWTLHIHKSELNVVVVCVGISTLLLTTKKPVSGH